MTYTSEEVRAAAAALGRTSYAKTLIAYADLLAQIERAEPYCYTWPKEPDADGVFQKIPLYTHPSADRLVTTNPAPHASAPSTPSKTVQMEVGCATTHSADRLAEALRGLIASGKRFRNTVVETRGVRGMDEHDGAIAAAEQALAAHAREPTDGAKPRNGVTR